MIGRVPYQPLSFKLKELAIPNELIINYDNGDIYITKEDGTLLNITEYIKEQITNMVGNSIIVDIDGYGVIEVDTILIDMIKEIDTSVKVAQVGDKDLGFYKYYDKLDDNSLESKNQVIQMKGFNSAEDYTIAYRKNGKLLWAKLVDIVQEGIGEIKNSGDLSNIDGKIYTVPERYGHNNKLYLEINKRQKTINPQETELNIQLPIILDEYAKIEWLVSFGNNAPIINLPSNVLKEIDTTIYPVPNNNTFIYTFETYDFGKMWLCSKRMFLGSYDINIHEEES